MMRNQREKFDAVEMKRQIQAKIREETEGLTREEYIEYARRRINESDLRDFWERVSKTDGRWASPRSRHGRLEIISPMEVRIDDDE